MGQSSSKSFNKLQNRLRMTQDHLYVVDLGLMLIEQNAPNLSPIKSFKDLGLPEGHYRKIKLKANNFRQITNHARARNAELAIQLLYTHFMEYLRSILQEMYNQKPLEVVSKGEGSLKFHQIVQLGSYDAICDHMIDQVFRSLENQRSTQDLLTKILRKTDVIIDPSIL